MYFLKDLVNTMISIMSAQPNPNPFKSQVKSGKIPESCNDSQNHQL